MANKSHVNKAQGSESALEGSGLCGVLFSGKGEGSEHSESYSAIITVDPTVTHIIRVACASLGLFPKAGMFEHALYNTLQLAIGASASFQQR